VKFCTVISCIDGRIQLPVFKYLQERFNAEFVDTITEAGPNRILAEKTNQTQIQSIFNRLEISVRNHDSVGIAVAGHHDCAGNPASREDQFHHLQEAAQLVKKMHKEIEVIILWVNENWEVVELETD